MSQRIGIDKIAENDRLQMRAGYSTETIEEYKRVLTEASESQPGDWPFATPVTLFRVDDTEDSYLLVDGFHRLRATKAAGRDWVEADIKTGTFNEALLLAIKANQQHGLPRSRQDKQKAVRAALTHPETCSKSDRDIARLCGVSHPTVATVRRELQPVVNLPHAPVTMAQPGGDVSQWLPVTPALDSAQTADEVFDDTDYQRYWTNADAGDFRRAFATIIRKIDLGGEMNVMTVAEHKQYMDAFQKFGNAWQQQFNELEWL